jgi:DNA-binding FadR family transcriptional regulator
MTNKKPIKAKAKSISRNLHVEIAGSIGERICAGEFPPGSILPNEAEWGRIHGASRTAIREGMKVLQAKGLIVSKPKIGSRVAPRAQWNLLDKDVFAWLGAAVGRKALLVTTQEFRRYIEPGIAELAAMKRKPDQLKALGEALTHMKSATRSHDTVEADVAFHRELLACANNELLNPFAVLIEQTLGSLFEFTNSANTRQRQAMNLHDRIYRAVKEQDPAAARKAMQDLIADTDKVVNGGKAAKA